MGNNAKDYFQWLNEIKSRSLRELTYLLISENIQHELIPAEIYYPIFDRFSKGQFGLNFYQNLRNSAIKELKQVDHRTALGRYAERLLAAWFSINPHFELLAFNHQLIKDQLTIGEIDFLLWEKENKRAIHLEFALKYYLAFPENGKTRYIGPKGRDTLEGKTKKLLEHQLKLCYNYPELLEDNLQAQKFKAQLMLKGIIFYPYQERIKNEAIWLRRKELESISLETNAHYFILENRRDWIYPYDPILRTDSLNRDEFKRRVEKTNNIPLLNLIVTEEEKEILLMIVDDDWPNEGKQ